MFGPIAVLDGDGIGTEVDGVQGVLQQLPNSLCIGRTNSNRSTGVQKHRRQILSLAEALSRAIRDTHCGMSMNSPWTGPQSRTWLPRTGACLSLIPEQVGTR